MAKEKAETDVDGLALMVCEGLNELDEDQLRKILKVMFTDIRIVKVRGQDNRFRYWFEEGS